MDLIEVQPGRVIIAHKKIPCKCQSEYLKDIGQIVIRKIRQVYNSTPREQVN